MRTTEVNSMPEKRKGLRASHPLDRRRAPKPLMLTRLMMRVD